MLPGIADANNREKQKNERPKLSSDLAIRLSFKGVEAEEKYFQNIRKI
jgi:hypothetical protein